MDKQQRRNHTLRHTQERRMLPEIPRKTQAQENPCGEQDKSIGQLSEKVIKEQHLK